MKVSGLNNIHGRNTHDVVPEEKKKMGADIIFPAFSFLCLYYVNVSPVTELQTWKKEMC